MLFYDVIHAELKVFMPAVLAYMVRPVRPQGNAMLAQVHTDIHPRKTSVTTLLSSPSRSPPLSRIPLLSLSLYLLRTLSFQMHTKISLFNVLLTIMLRIGPYIYLKLIFTRRLESLPRTCRLPFNLRTLQAASKLAWTSSST